MPDLRELLARPNQRRSAQTIEQQQAMLYQLSAQYGLKIRYTKRHADTA